MRVDVRLFAACRERARTDHRSFEFTNDSIPLSELIARISADLPDLVPLLPFVRFAVNHEFALPTATIRHGDEIAVIPPVSGGSGLGPFALTERPIDVAAVVAGARGPEIGAVVTFEGTVRNQTGDHAVLGLEYEAYPEMAEAFLRRIGSEIFERWPGTRVSIVHRTGKLELGEVSIVIAVGAPHRGDAFEACRHAIERIKVDVPIWKKELRRDGSVWVGLGS
ncbi:MAG: molybdenum cofactor biosynthesis protein MoaE [Deltaproteobacteria bacterium]|nr:molybdenum cofactor biosynthesis protein MoaE [Deltaproteobacteria bacterium]